jgi:two-component system, OmpR family, sensor histidine kinase KdpD
VSEPRPRSLTLREVRPSALVGVLAAIVGVGVTTAVVYPLKSVAPTVSLGVVYIVPVLLISAYWGLWLGLATALVSAAAFNFFHLPPVGYFTLADGRDWVALAVFALVATVTSTVSDLARARAQEAERGRQEADLAAALGRALLAGTETGQALADAGQHVGEALGIAEVAIELQEVAPERGQRAVPLRAGGRQIATMLVPERLDATTEQRLEDHVIPSLEALVAVALHRDALQAEAVETAAVRRSDELKTVLLRSVSHDLRTPLTAMLTAGHALRSPSLTEGERRDLTAALLDEGGRLSDLVDKLLDLSRLESGRAEPHLTWTSLEEVLSAARDGLPADAEVRVAVDSDLPGVRVDAAQLERAFANVLENAVRHSGGHPVQVRARAVGSRVLVRIVDRGPGVPLAEHERIFEPFYRPPASDARRGGAGLGLAIARGFIEANGGRIWVESLPGQGTSFVVEFPAEQSATVSG